MRQAAVDWCNNVMPLIESHRPSSNSGSSQTHTHVAGSQVADSPAHERRTDERRRTCSPREHQSCGCTRGGPSPRQLSGNPVGVRVPPFAPRTCSSSILPFSLLGADLCPRYGLRFGRAYCQLAESSWQRGISRSGFDRLVGFSLVGVSRKRSVWGATEAARP
jgi:hypothetical protein